MKCNGYFLDSKSPNFIERVSMNRYFAVINFGVT